MTKDPCLASVFVGEPPPHEEAGESSLLRMSPTFLRIDASVPLLLFVPPDGALRMGERQRDGLGLRLGLRLSGDLSDGSAASSNMRDFLLFGGATGTDSGAFDVEGIGESAFSLARNISHMSRGAMKLLRLPRLDDAFLPDAVAGGVAAARVRDMSSALSSAF